MGNTRKRHGPATTAVPPQGDGERPAIRLTCMVAGHKGEWIEYKGTGWLFRHRRLAEEAMTVQATVALLAERLAGWNLLDDGGREIPFKPWLPRKRAANAGAEPDPDDSEGGQRVNSAFLDLVPPDVAQWVVGTLYEAYAVAAIPHPN
jgi:hypothetical protein